MKPPLTAVAASGILAVALLFLVTGCGPSTPSRSASTSPRPASTATVFSVKPSTVTGKAAKAPVSSHAQQASAPVVVATWFSDQRAKVGLRETVYVQVTQAKRTLGGAPLSATITYGKHELTLKGTATDKRGIARATFTVPRQARGETAWALTTVSYKGHQYRGSNHVNVAR